MKRKKWRKNSTIAKEWHQTSNWKDPCSAKLDTGKRDSKSFQRQRKKLTYKKSILTDFSRVLDARIEFLWESNFEPRIT